MNFLMSDHYAKQMISNLVDVVSLISFAQADPDHAKEHLKVARKWVPYLKNNINKIENEINKELENND